MIGSSLLFILLLLDGEITFRDGFILFFGLLAYIGYHLYSAVKISKENRRSGLETVLNEKRQPYLERLAGVLRSGVACRGRSSDG